MNYTVTLAGGGTLELSFKNGLDIIESALRADEDKVWLVDDNGVMVNMTYVAAMVPEGVGASAAPAVVKDGDGTSWTRREDGLYYLHDTSSSGWTLGEINDNYGPWRAV